MTELRYPDRLSAHFSFHDLVRSDTAARHGIDNNPPLEFVPRLVELAGMLERVRAKLCSLVGRDVPILPTSGYRCEKLNEMVGGQKNSDHLYARACDFEAPAYGTPYQIALALSVCCAELGIGQLIYEGVKGKRWVHVSTNDNRPAIDRVITISDAGTRPGIINLQEHA